MSRLARPPFIDATTGIAYDTDKAEFEGYLTKQSMWLRVRRIFHIYADVFVEALKYAYHNTCMHNICLFFFSRIGDGDISFSRDLGCSLPRHHMRHHTV